MQSAENMKIARQKIEDDQTACDHRKPNGKSAIMGQKLHTGPKKDHFFTFVCGYCNKEFNEYTVPPTIRPDMAMVGGPDV